MTDYPSIFERMASGKSLRSICVDDGLKESTIRSQISVDESLFAQYTHARELQADHYAEKIVDEAATATDAALGRLKMDALKWAASKMAPKKYGDKVAHEHGGEGGGPIKTALTVEFIRSAT